MKRLLLLGLFITGMSITAFSQDFSYLKDIDLNDANQIKQAKEDITECCYYLIAERYDKKDIQRQQATDFVSKWIHKYTNTESIITESINEMSEGREDINNMYIVCYAMQIVEQESEESEEIIREKALSAVLDYCLNPVHKIKPTKAMKQLASK